MKMTQKVRNAIAGLSTGGRGTYYLRPSAFFSSLDWVLRDHGLQLVNSPYTDPHADYPTIHNDDGRGRIAVCALGMDTPLFDVVYMWHRMPSSNWEFICYPTG